MVIDIVHRGGFALLALGLVGVLTFALLGVWLAIWVCCAITLVGTLVFCFSAPWYNGDWS